MALPWFLHPSELPGHSLQLYVTMLLCYILTPSYDTPQETFTPEDWGFTLSLLVTPVPDSGSRCSMLSDRRPHIFLGKRTWGTHSPCLK